MTIADSVHTANVLDEVSEEREKQRGKWGNDHDDRHTDGSLSLSGSTYAMAAAVSIETGVDHESLSAPDSVNWPWGPDAWRPEETVRATLLKAAALIVAEIERLDRAGAQVTP